MHPQYHLNNLFTWVTFAYMLGYMLYGIGPPIIVYNVMTVIYVVARETP